MIPCLAVLREQDCKESKSFQRNMDDIDDDATIKLLLYIMENYGPATFSTETVNKHGKRKIVKLKPKDRMRHMFLSHNGSRCTSII